MFKAQDSRVPKIIFSVKEPIPLEKKVNPDRFLSLAIKALETVTDKFFKSGLGAPAKIFCVLSSPWYVSQTRIINFKKDVPFVFTPKLADELIQKEIHLFEKEHSTDYAVAGNSVRAIELKNIKTTLNGYETSQPLDQKAKELEMTLFVSMSGENLLQKIESVISGRFHLRPLRFSSFAMASFAVARGLHLERENFLLIDINGEVTDISMSKKNVLRESISFPLGYNFLIRGVASDLNCSLEEAGSLVSLFNDGHAEESITKKLALSVERLRAEWLKKFQESLANLSNDLSVPATIYLTIDKNLCEFFSEAIKKEQFSQYTLAESKFEVIFLNTQILHGLAAFEEDTVRDPFLIINSIYINNFLNNI